MSKLKYLSRQNIQEDMGHVPFSYYLPFPNLQLNSSEAEITRNDMNFRRSFIELPLTDSIYTPFRNRGKNREWGNSGQWFKYDLELKPQERFIHLGMEVLLHDSSAMESLTPEFLQYLLNKNKLNSMLSDSKKVIATYGKAQDMPHNLDCLNGIGFILSEKAFDTHSCDRLNKIFDEFENTGRYFQDDVLRGYNYHLTWKRYNDMLKKGKFKL